MCSSLCINTYYLSIKIKHMHALKYCYSVSVSPQPLNSTKHKLYYIAAVDYLYLFSFSVAFPHFSAEDDIFSNSKTYLISVVYRVSHKYKTDQKKTNKEKKNCHFNLVNKFLSFYYLFLRHLDNNLFHSTIYTYMRDSIHSAFA